MNFKHLHITKHYSIDEQKKYHIFLQVLAIILDKVGQNLETVKLMEVTFFLQSGKENALFLERCQNGVKNRA